ncbi:MAG: IS110 family transposase [Gammaproteobacteria bacterium]|nr:IS110 family transposase [Gammaproteobacteria bacterium]
MKKRTYKTKKVNQINWNLLKARLAGEEVALAIDIAKKKQFALLFNKSNDVSELFRWSHPEETPAVLEAINSLSCPVVVIVESTSTYGDAIRFQFSQLGFDIHQASAKRVHDAKEVYDGVPSLHDAKSATIIGRFYQDKLTTPWRELTEEERRLNALRREFDMHQGQYQRNKGRLEAFLSRHWPEVTYLLDLDSVALEHLLIKYGSARQIADHAKEAALEMKKIGRNMLKAEKINQVIESAKTTLGVPCTEAELLYFQALAREMAHSRVQGNKAKKTLEAAIDSDSELYEMGRLIGRVTTAVLLSFHLDPRNFDCAQSFQKALGLNLKEKSSGRYIGQLKLTKRGSAKARQYLYFAALRLLQRDPIVKEWYLKKMDPKAKNKTVIALMRKLSKALWHVGRGQAFDATKLLSVAKKAA